jgi:hypothetical protein
MGQTLVEIMLPLTYNELIVNSMLPGFVAQVQQNLGHRGGSVLLNADERLLLDNSNFVLGWVQVMVVFSGFDVNGVLLLTI